MGRDTDGPSPVRYPCFAANWGETMAFRPMIQVLYNAAIHCRIYG